MYITGIDPTADWDTDISAGGNGPQHALGSLGMNVTDQGAKVYKYVKLRNETATVAVAAGDMLAYLAAPASDTEVSTVVADFTDASTKPMGAGVAWATVTGTLATAYYGWVQVTGYAVLNQALGGTVAAGDALMCSTTDKAVTLATAADDYICAIGHVDATKNVRLCCVF